MVIWVLLAGVVVGSAVMMLRIRDKRLDSMEPANEDLGKLALKGRVYPTIRSCVDNRYRILAGIAAYYGFVLATSMPLHRVSVLVTAVMAAFVLHNLYNYWTAAKEQFVLEKKAKDTWHAPFIELIFAGAAMVALFGLYFSIGR